MTRKRMPSTERRAQIVTAARHVFSRHGYDGAKTMQIAKAANVSEALVFRHFPSKLALYRAVLRQIFLEQDQNWQDLGPHDDGAEGLVRSIHAFIKAAVADGPEGGKDSYRMTLASLAGDGSYASLIYRRSQRLNRDTVAHAHENARANGDMTGETLSPDASSMFMEHVGTMLGAITALPQSAWPYGIGRDELVRQATWFCCRGIGLADAVIARHIQD